MIKFNKNTLDAELVLGDTGTFSIVPKIDGVKALNDGDEVWFTMRKVKDKVVVLQKRITAFEDGKATIPILPGDTSSLEPGNYIYDLKLIRSDGNVDTLMPNSSASFSLKRGVK